MGARSRRRLRRPLRRRHLSNQIGECVTLMWIETEKTNKFKHNKRQPQQQLLEIQIIPLRFHFFDFEFVDGKGSLKTNLEFQFESRRKRCFFETNQQNKTKNIDSKSNKKEKENAMTKMY